ncbi:hypothetical protein [Flavobacterium pedocola]
MKTLHSILSEKIFSLTEKIHENFPALYEHLSETPFSLKVYNGHEVEDVDLIHYLEELVFQMNFCKKMAVECKDNTTAYSLKNLNDTSESQNENWGEQKEKLLERYSALSETDLFFLEGKKVEMLEKVRKILCLTKEELRLVLSRF